MSIHTFSIRIEGPESQMDSSVVKSIKKTWKEASNLFAKKEYVRDGQKVIVSIKWPDSKEIKLVTQEQYFIVEIRVDMSKSELFSHRRDLAADVVEHFLFDIFICMNLATPGSMNMFNTEVHEKDKMYWSSFPFEQIWYILEKDNDWPRIEGLPLKKVINWYEGLAIELRQIARTNIERAIFAIMRFVESPPGDSQTNVIWMTHALESLFGTKNGGILESLKRRIKLHLGNEGYTKKINSTLSRFYNYRSRFVHGELPIMRRKANETIEGDVMGRYMEQYESCDLPLAILVSSFQKLIMDGKHEMNFVETIKYK